MNETNNPNDPKKLTPQNTLNGQTPQATTNNNKTVEGASTKFGPNEQGALGKLGAAAKTVTSEFVELAKGTSSITDTIGRLETQIGGNSKFVSGGLGMLRMSLELSDKARESYKTLAESIASSTGVLAGNFMAVEDNVNQLSEGLIRTAQATGQSFKQITEGVSQLMSTSSDIAQSFSSTATAGEKVGATFDAYSELAITARNAGISLNDAMNLSQDMFSKQGQALRNMNNPMESTIGLMRAMTAAVNNTGASMGQVKRFVSDTATSYEFLNYSSRKTALTMGTVTSFAKENKDVFKSSDQALRVYSNALQGVAGAQMDMGQSLFHGTMSGAGGFIGARAALSFEDMEGPEAMHTMMENIAQMTGGKILTKEEAMSSDMLANQYIVQRQMIGEATKLDPGQAKKFQESYARGLNLGDLEQQQKAQEILDLGGDEGADKFQQADKEYQAKLYSSSELSNRILASIQGNTQKMASNLIGKATQEGVIDDAFKKIQSLAESAAPAEVKELLASLKSKGGEGADKALATLKEKLSGPNYEAAIKQVEAAVDMVKEVKAGADPAAAAAKANEQNFKNQLEQENKLGTQPQSNKQSEIGTGAKTSSNIGAETPSKPMTLQALNSSMSDILNQTGGNILTADEAATSGDKAQTFLKQQEMIAQKFNLTSDQAKQFQKAYSQGDAGQAQAQQIYETAQQEKQAQQKQKTKIGASGKPPSKEDMNAAMAKISDITGSKILAAPTAESSDTDKQAFAIQQKMIADEFSLSTEQAQQFQKAYAQGGDTSQAQAQKVLADAYSKNKKPQPLVGGAVVVPKFDNTNSYQTQKAQLAYGAASSQIFTAGLEPNVAAKIVGQGTSNYEFGAPINTGGVTSSATKADPFSAATASGGVAYQPDIPILPGPPSELSQVVATDKSSPAAKTDLGVVPDKTTILSAQTSSKADIAASLQDQVQGLVTQDNIDLVNKYSDTKNPQQKTALQQLGQFMTAMKGKDPADVPAAMQEILASGSQNATFDAQKAGEAFKAQGNTQMADLMKKWETAAATGKVLAGEAPATQSGYAGSKESKTITTTTSTEGFDTSNLELAKASKSGKADKYEAASNYTQGTAAMQGLLSPKQKSPPTTTVSAPTEQFQSAASMNIPQIDAGKTSQNVLVEKSKKDKALAATQGAGSTASEIVQKSSGGAPLTAQVVINVNGNALMETLVQTTAFEKGVQTQVNAKQANAYKQGHS